MLGKLSNVLNSLSRNGGINEVAHQLSINNLEGLSASSFFTKIASFVCPDGGPNDEGMARSAYFDVIAENQMLYGKRLKYSRLAVWYHFSDFDEPHSSLK